MNAPSKGYFCLVQYCPDLARRESVNVGVLLFSPVHGFLEARLSSGNQRVRRFFGDHADHLKHINAMKDALIERIRVERREFGDLEDLSAFVTTRANRILLTPPKAIRVNDPARDLNALYGSLVAEPEKEHAAMVGLPMRTRLDDLLLSPDLATKVLKSIRVQVPTLKREVEMPFGYQNGRFNLIQPTVFKQKSIEKVRDAACRFAVEGDSLYQTQDPNFGDLQLVVVADFLQTGTNGAEAVRDLFSEYHVMLYTQETLNVLEENIRMHGKVIAG